MKKTISAFLAVAMTVGAFATAMPAAKAEGGRNAAAIGLGILGAAVVGGAIANGNRPAYGYDAGPAYYEPRCRFVEREPVWDGYGWRARRPIRVCD